MPSLGLILQGNYLMRLKQNFSLLIAALLLVACTSEKPVYKDEFLVFGTLVSLEIVGEDPATAAHASKEVQAMFDVLHVKWHAWEQGGLLAKINTAIADNTTLQLNPDVVTFLEKIKTLSRQSDYYFNPAIGPLVALWGFHANSPQPSSPSKAAINALIQPMLRMDSLAFSGGTLVSLDPRVQLDLGAVAKGYAIDLAIDTLKAQGIKNAVVNAGGDLRVLGTNPKQAPWLIGVRNPKGGVLGSIALLDHEAAVSSGDYERSYSIKNKRIHHIINPYTGRPSQGIRAVTVVHTNAMVADAASTALMVAGLKNWRAVAAKMGISTALVVDEKGNIFQTKQMKARFTLP